MLSEQKNNNNNIYIHDNSLISNEISKLNFTSLFNIIIFEINAILLLIDKYNIIQNELLFLILIIVNLYL